MRSYLAMELIAAIWLMGATLAVSENLDRIWVFCCFMAALYYLRAMIKYFTKETSNAPKTDRVKPAGTYAGGMRMRSSSSRRGNDATRAPGVNLHG